VTGADAEMRLASGGAEPVPGSAEPVLRSSVPEPAGASGPAGAGPSGSASRRMARPTRWPGIAARSAVGGARAFGRWSHRPVGRSVLPGLLIALLVAVTGAAGADLVPSAARSLPAPAASASAPGVTAEAPTTQAPQFPPLATFDPVTPNPADVPGREAAKLAGWAQPLAERTEIPQVALEAYGYAEWVLSQTQPGCNLRWPTLAAIGKVESNHGRANGATLTPDGRAFPPIIGQPLDGQGARKLIRDTDSAALDNDPIYDRAIGPMQFLPSTWRTWAVDADNSGSSDPHDIDDATLAAAKYLCAGGRDLATAAGWWDAVLSYNDVQAYAQDVFQAANDYGQTSRNTP
jgi:membrane-bound lytic murein transglycosylase B